MSGKHFLALICTFFVLLSSCTSKTQINLFAAHLDQKQVNNITGVIDPTVFELRVNHVVFPKSISQNTLIYTPSLNSNQNISALINALTDIGYDINAVSLLHQDNQSFTENNIGLYLVPAGYKPRKINMIQNIVNEYGSITCHQTSNLYLKESGEFKIEVDIWLDIEERYGEYIVKGTWQKSNNEIIYLNSNKWQSTLSFTRTFSIENTPDGKRHVVSLKPLYQEEIAGDFLINKEKNQPNVNCIYTISLVI